MKSMRRARSWLFALVALLAFGGSLAPASAGRAAPATVAPATASTVASTLSVALAPRETNKVVLGETSIDGPSFWTNVPTGQPGAGGTNTTIAWTGTDAAHHLNTMVLGASGFGNKQILNETSIARPAVTAEPSQMHPPYTFLAWTGTNAAHSLNIICDGCASSRIKLTLWNETSFAGPAVAMLGGKLLLAWTGVDANHSLNVLDISIENGRFVLGHKDVLTDFSSNAGPALTFNPDTTFVGAQNVLLSWSDKLTKRIKVASAGAGPTRTWPRAGWFTYSELSAATPSMLGLVPVVNISRTYLAWTGIDPGHSLNLLYPAYLSRLDSTKATLRETAWGGPALGYLGGNRLALLWTGTDPTHHLNFATIEV